MIKYQVWINNCFAGQISQEVGKLTIGNSEACRTVLIVYDLQVLQLQ